MRKTIFLLLLILQIVQVWSQTKDLNYFIGEGLENSPLLKEYKNKEHRNKLDSMNIAAASGFQVNVVSTNSYAPVIKGYGYDEVKTDKANVSALLSVSRELTGAQNRRKHFESIELQNQSSRNAGKITEQQLKKDITDQYITTFNYEQQYLFGEEILKLLNKEEILLNRLTQTGAYRQTDYLSFVVSLRQQKIGVNTLKNQYEYDYFTLCYLCGVADTTVFSLSDPSLNTTQIPDVSSSVFSRQFELDSLKIQNEKELVDLAYKPKISAFADAGYLSSLAYMPSRNFGASAGFSLSIPIYDGGQKDIQHKQLAIDELDRSNYVGFYKSQYQQQINNLWKRLKANSEMSVQISEQIAYVQTLMEADHKLLESGDLRISDYLDAISNFLNAKNQLIQNKVEKYQLINELNYWNRSK